MTIRYIIGLYIPCCENNQFITSYTDIRIVRIFYFVFLLPFHGKALYHPIRATNDISISRQSDIFYIFFYMICQYLNCIIRLHLHDSARYISFIIHLADCQIQAPGFIHICCRDHIRFVHNRIKLKFFLPEISIRLFSCQPDIAPIFSFSDAYIFILNLTKSTDLCHIKLCHPVFRQTRLCLCRFCYLMVPTTPA